MNDQVHGLIEDGLIKRLAAGFGALLDLAEELARRNEDLEQQVKCLQSQVVQLSLLHDSGEIFMMICK